MSKFKGFSVNAKGPKLSKVYRSTPSGSVKLKFAERLGLPKLPARIPFINKDKGRFIWLNYFREPRINTTIWKYIKYCNIIYKVDCETVRLLFVQMIALYEKFVYENGALYAVKTLKGLSGIVGRYCVNERFDPMPFTKVSKDQLPLRIGFLKPLMRGEINERKCAIFISQLYKLALVEGEPPKVNSITDPMEHEFKGNSKYCGHFIHNQMLAKGYDKDTTARVVTAWKSVVRERFLSKHTLKRFTEVQLLSDIHISTKGGPNGPALGTSPIDWIALKEDDLWKAIVTIAKMLKHRQLQKFVISLRMFGVKIIQRPDKTICSGRVRLKKEPGGKMRLFAVLDFFTQTALKGFHKWCFNWLSGQEGDGTMSHNRVAFVLKAWTSNPLFVAYGIYSADLSTATDRLPAKLQHEVITAMMGREFADVWLTLLTRRPFTIDNGTKIYYNTGQPMGALSSWAMLAITHHLILRTALKLCKTKLDGVGEAKLVIGDDVCIIGKEMYENYTLLMRDVLGVPISKMKGFTSETHDCGNPIPGLTCKGVGEVAKRIFVGGVEFTPVPPDEVKAGLEYPGDFPCLLRSMYDRGLLSEVDYVPAIALSRLRFKPNQALETATFPPCAPPPFRSWLTQDIVVMTDLPVEIQKLNLPWFSVGLSQTRLLGQFARYLREDLADLIERSLMFINEQVRSKTSASQISSRDYLYSSTYHKVLWSEVASNLSNLVIGSMFKCNVYEGVSTWKDISEALNGLQIVNDFTLFLEGKPRDQDKQRRTNKKIAELVRRTSACITSTNFSSDVLALLQQAAEIDNNQEVAPYIILKPFKGEE